LREGLREACATPEDIASRRAYAASPELSREESVLVLTIVQEYEEAVKSASAEIRVRAAWAMAGLFSAIFVIAVWLLGHIVLGELMNAATEWVELAGIFAAVALGWILALSLYRVVEIRSGEAAYWMGSCSYIVALLLVGATVQGVTRKNISEEVGFGGVVLALAILLALYFMGLLFFYWFLPGQWLPRRLRRSYSRASLGMGFVNLAVEIGEYRRDLGNTGRMRRLQRQTNRLADEFQFDWPQSGALAVERRIFREQGWRIAHAKMMWLARTVMPRFEERNEFLPRHLLRAAASARAGWWGNLPHVDEHPSWWDLRRDALLRATPVLGVIIISLGFSTVAVVGWGTALTWMRAQEWFSMLLAIGSVALGAQAYLTMRR
jgi:hypothetical protein